MGSRQRSDEPNYWAVYKWTLGYMRPYMWPLIGFIACGLVLVVADLSVPKFIQLLVDHVIPDRDLALFGLLVAGMLGILVLRLAATFGTTLMQRRFTEKAARDLQLSILAKLRTLGFAYYEKHPVGETLTLFHTDSAAVQRFYRDLFPFMLLRSIMLVLSIVMLVTIDPLLSLILVPCLVLYYWTGRHFEKKAGDYRKETNEVRAEVNAHIYNSIAGQTEIRSNGSHDWSVEKVMERQRKLNVVELKMWRFLYYRISSRFFAVNLGILAFFAIGGYMVLNDRLSVGAFVAFSMYFLDVAFSTTAVVNMITQQKAVMFQAERIASFMKEEAAVREGEEPRQMPANVRGEFEFRGVGFSYDYGRPVLEDFTLSIKPGEKLALVGTSGGGKSTIMKLIGRFYDPMHGEILLDRVPIRELPLGELRRTIGFVFQETYLFGNSIRENIRFGNLDATDDEIVLAAKAAYAHDFIMSFPDGYDTVVGERGVKLSGGQKQRIAIARMFVKQPAVILLDEATSSLDNASETEVEQALRALMEGRTTITVAHRLSTIKDYDRIAVMAHGRIAEMGNYSELLANRGALYQLEMGQMESEADVSGAADSTDLADAAEAADEKAGVS